MHGLGTPGDHRLFTAFPPGLAGDDLAEDLSVDAFRVIGAGHTALDTGDGFFGEEFPGDIDRASVGEPPTIMVVEVVAVFPDDVAVPVVFPEVAAGPNADGA